MGRIVRPTPLPPPEDSLDKIRDYLGYTVCAGDYAAECGLLAPGIYGREDAIAFLSAIEALGSNEAIDAWLDANPL